MTTNLPSPNSFSVLRALVILSACCSFVVASVLIATGIHANDRRDGSGNPSAAQAAMKVLDEFMLSFNNRDMAAWSETLNYPHVRFASGEVRVWQDIEEFSATPPFSALSETGWDHSHWISRKVVMSSPAKVHIATVFQRFNSDNQSIGVYESMYIVTRVGGRWGIQSRSSLAP